MKTLHSFAFCDRGNIAILTAIIAVPLMVAIAGAVETSRQTETVRILQTAADAAVTAAFHRPELNWRERRAMARAHFHANLGRRFPAKRIETRLSGSRRGTQITLTFHARTTLESLFTRFMSSSQKEVRVSSTARVTRRPSTGRGRAQRS